MWQQARHTYEKRTFYSQQVRHYYELQFNSPILADRGDCDPNITYFVQVSTQGTDLSWAELVAFWFAVREAWYGLQAWLTYFCRQLSFKGDRKECINGNATFAILLWEDSSKYYCSWLFLCQRKNEKPWIKVDLQSSTLEKNIHSCSNFVLLFYISIAY